jgi:hypothetical protein
MATATLIAVPVYAINQQLVDRTLYPFGMSVQFAGASLNVQTNNGTSLQQLQAAATPGAALVYSRVRSSVTGDAIFYSNLTPAQISVLANA